jgi:hypothetical protein
MNTIFSYNDILKENVSNLTDHAGLVSCALDFLRVQDELPDISSGDDNGFILNFILDGYKYKITGYIENGEIKLKGIYRTGGDDILEYNNLGPDEFKDALNTRDIYTKLCNKIIRIIKKESD